MATTMDQHVRLYYLGDSPSLETEKPYIISPGFMKSVPECNWKYAAGPVQTIKDARGREGDFSLLKQGFAFRKWTPSKINWESESDIIDKYLPEAQDFIARELNLGDGLKRCEAFDWRLRISGSTDELTNLDKGHMTKIRPAQAVHIDQSSAGAFDRLIRHYAVEDVEELVSKYRVQIINMWRPFRGVVEQWPLAICDASNTTLDDMEELEYVTEEFVRSSYLGKWSDKLQFWYLSRMTSDEVAVFKIFDSAYHAPQGDSPGASTLGCLHAAFEIPAVASAPPRESVEVRMFVISEY
ncbi:hypothetical protein BJ166DRAFT_513332 [Pestalotiopsis sp. NC0098]|nr:hypothetical protein BJ166DRAFT_513332 [Pestalotiopsis sp. NC0098]